MIYLILAIFSSAMVSITMRLSETKSQSPFSLLACNYIMCSLIALLYCDGFQLNASLFGFGVFSGSLYLLSFLLMQFNVRVNGVILSSTFMKLGVLVPVVASMVIFQEKPGPAQLMGLIIAVCAIIFLKDKTEGKQFKLIPLIALLIAGGFTDFTSKIFDAGFSSSMKDVFLLLIFASAALMCLTVVIMKRQSITKSEIVFGSLIGIPNYFSSRFLLLSLSHIDAIVAYPTFSVSTILLVSLLGVVLFHEKMTKRQVGVMGLIMTALILLNLS